MKGTSLTPRPLFVLAGLLGAALVAACSGGGGSSSTPPTPGPALGGIGSTIAFDQHVNFTVIVPPATAAVAAARRKHPAATTATNPYVSPNTASVALQVVTVSGQSPRTLPAQVVINIACGGTTGCSVPIQNVPAAKGVDRFSVQTFSGTGGTGNLISTGFIDVTVPSAQAASFGGTTLTIGGFVASLSLAMNIPGGAFLWNTPASGTIDVNAIDPAGATIIGSDQLANPIEVTLPSTDGGAFTINGLQQVALQAPAQTIALAYNGSVNLGGTVTASTTDENSQPVATSLPIPVQQAPTPTPTLVPPNKPPLSLYVYDSATDHIIEYAGVNNVEDGQPFSKNPRRVFDVALSPAFANTLTCNQNPVVESMAVAKDGTLYAQTYCFDQATSSQAYTFVYPPSTTEIVPPLPATPTPPAPRKMLSVTATTPGGSPAYPEGIKLDEAHGTAFLQYESTGTTGNVIGVPLTTFANPTTNFGAACLQELGLSLPCTDPTSGYLSSYAMDPYNFAIDGNGQIYIPESYGVNDANGDLVIPPDDPSNPGNAVPGEEAVLVFPVGLNNAAPAPLSALAGFHDELGAQGGSPELAFEGTTLYVLANNPGQILLPGTASGNNLGTQVYAGFSGCPYPAGPPSPPPTDTPTDTCADTTTDHQYLAGFTNAGQTLTSPIHAGTNVVSPPAFMIGGDSVGQFGIEINSPGDAFAVKEGFAYVLSLPENPGVQPSQLNVYDVRTVTGFHTNIEPITNIVLDPSIQPTTIAIGPTGTGTGGLELLSRPARVHRDVKAWERNLQRRRQELRNRWRLPMH